MKAKRIESGEYIYRGFKLYNIGYFAPDHRVCWEAIDKETGDAVAHAYTKHGLMNELDYLIHKEEKEVSNFLHGGK